MDRTSVFAARLNSAMQTHGFKQIDIVTDAVALKIADLLPRYPEDVRAIFSKERVTLEPQQIQQIIDIVEKHI